MIRILLVFRLLFVTVLMSAMTAHHKKVTAEHGDEKDEVAIVAPNAKKRQHKYEEQG